MDFDVFPHEFFRQVDEANRRQIEEANQVVQAWKATWEQDNSCLSSAAVTSEQLRTSENTLVAAKGVLAQVAGLGNGQAGATATMQGLLQNQIATACLADSQAPIIAQGMEIATATQAQFDALAADIDGAGKSLIQCSDVLAESALAAASHIVDAFESAEAALRRFQENQLVVTTQPNMGEMVAAMASIQQPHWNSQVSLIKTCFEEARILSETVGTPAGVPIYIQSLLDSQRALESAYGNQLQAALRWNFEDAIGPALATLRGGQFQPDFGLMIGNEMGGLLTWDGSLGHDRSLLSAPLLPAVSGCFTGPRAKLLRVRCNVICRWCGEPLIAKGGDQVVDGASAELIIDLTVVPLCPKCLKQAAADPSYLERCLGETSGSAAPQFRLIRGEAESISAPRGRAVLHLVTFDQALEDS